MKGASARHSPCCLRGGTSTSPERQLGKRPQAWKPGAATGTTGKRLFCLLGEIVSPAVHVLTEYDRASGTGVCRECGSVPLKYRAGSPRCGIARNQQRGQTNRNTATRKAREEVSAAVRSLKLERGCTDCGYNEHPAALDFDHRPGVAKTMNISDMVGLGKTWLEIMTEIDKCDIVCANCHRIRTVERLQDN